MSHADVPADGADVRPFRSILFDTNAAPDGVDEAPQPPCFPDLNLDQIVDGIAGLKQAYRLTGFFRLPLDDVGAIEYRQAVFRDLESRPCFEAVADFADGMTAVRDHLARAGKSHYRHQQQRWFLDAASTYCATVEALADGLRSSEPASRGLRGLADYLAAYRGSPGFVALRDEAAAVARDLDAITYDVWIHGAKVTVGCYDDEADYSAAVTDTFARFRQGTRRVSSDTRRRLSSPRPLTDLFMDHVEAQVLEQVAHVFPRQFAALDTFCGQHDGFRDRIVVVFDREVQFYLAYLAYLAPLRKAGLDFDYPRLSADDKTEHVTDTFDLALAAQLVPKDAKVVCNDVRLDGPERILVVSGPNNGGKTTTARTVGQLHYLAKLGCAVPGRDAALYLVDQIYAHFEKAEDIETLAGKLQDELNRLHADFEHATSRSLIVLNEMFNSTTVQDALFLSREILERVAQLDALGVCVTFLDELSTLNEKTVSMVSTVEPDNLARRTFKVVRKPADGRAFAHALAEKYGLTYDTLKGRVAS